MKVFYQCKVLLRNIRYLSFLMTLCLLSLYKLCEKRRFSEEGGDDCKDVATEGATVCQKR